MEQETSPPSLMLSTLLQIIVMLIELLSISNKGFMRKMWKSQVTSPTLFCLEMEVVSLSLLVIEILSMVGPLSDLQLSVNQVLSRTPSI